MGGNYNRKQSVGILTSVSGNDELVNLDQPYTEDY